MERCCEKPVWTHSRCRGSSNSSLAHSLNTLACCTFRGRCLSFVSYSRLFCTSLLHSCLLSRLFKGSVESTQGEVVEQGRGVSRGTRDEFGLSFSFADTRFVLRCIVNQVLLLWLMGLFCFCFCCCTALIVSCGAGHFIKQTIRTRVNTKKTATAASECGAFSDRSFL
jgi:hypothetical protein